MWSAGNRPKWKIASALSHQQHSEKFSNQNLTNVVQSNPVRGVHFLLNVPGYDQILASVQSVLQSGGRQWGPALGAHQVRVTVGPGEPNGTADDWGRIDGGAPPLRQRPQVLWAEGVPEVRAAPTGRREMLAASNGQVGRVVGAGPSWQDRCGEGRSHDVQLVKGGSYENNRPKRKFLARKVLLKNLLHLFVPGEEEVEVSDQRSGFPPCRRLRCWSFCRFLLLVLWSISLQ